MDQDFGQPITPLQEPKRSNTPLIIAIVVVVLICCCCLIFLVAAWTFGDSVVRFFQSYFNTNPGLGIGI